MIIGYRVAIEGMFGKSDEEFFLTLPDAQKRFEEIIQEKREDENTLSDEGCESEHQQEKNFSEAKIFDCVKQTNNIRKLRGVFWSYEHASTSENGTEYYSYTDEIVLEEITLG